MQKCRAKFDPSLGNWIGNMFHVGTVPCQVIGGGIWYRGRMPRLYSTSVYLGFYKRSSASTPVAHPTENDPEQLLVLAIPKGYDPGVTGLIYTDPGFLRDVKALLKELGMLAWSRVDYSEQGMQGSNYVDMEVCSKRAVKWLEGKTS